MQRMKLNLSRVLVCLCLLNLPILVSAQNGEQDLLPTEIDTLETLTEQQLQSSQVLPFSDNEVRERLGYLSSCLQLNYTASVRSYLTTYFYRKREKAEGLLGKRLMYFPLFEAKLKEHGLPNDLKYLSVVESALNAEAYSRAGASGLWQFMPQTGLQYGLRINKQVDERNDPVASTDAAMRYLKDLYRQFNDWALALAAYNSGPTRVRNAIKRAHSSNFWRIQRYLPAETANYVPAFIAATYLCNYWQMHNMIAADPEMDLQLTSYIKIWEGISFSSIANATGLDYQIVKKLNPGYRKDYIPATMEGHFVVLPTRVMTAFVGYMNNLSSQRSYIADLQTSFIAGSEDDGKYATTVFRIEQGDNVDRIGMSIGACGEHLKSWNDLKSSWVPAGTTLKVWRPVVIKKHEQLKNDLPAAPKPVVKKPKPAPPASPLPNKTASEPPTIPTKQPEIEKQKLPKPQHYVWHTVRRNETLSEISKKYEVSEEEIKRLNDLQNLKIGMRLKVKLEE